VKKLLGILISLIILGVLYSRLDFAGMMNALSDIKSPLLILCFLLFIPQFLLTAYRWKVICRPYYQAGMRESLSLILSGNALNLFLPSKMGDIAKAAFLHNHSTLDWRKGLDFVFFEKSLDLSSMSLWMVICFLVDPILGRVELAGFFLGLAFIVLTLLIYSGSLGSGEGVERWIGRISPRVGKALGGLLNGAISLKNNLIETGLLKKVILISFILWFLHLLQFYFFFQSLALWRITIVTVFALVPLAIFIGLLPLTFSGIGTRDAALIYLFRPWASYEKMALVGVFSMVRYLVPGLLGLPAMGMYSVSLKKFAKK
jgi:uncharacterized protein (TIRG00374 family)